MQKENLEKKTRDHRNKSRQDSLFTPVAAACALLCALSASPVLADTIDYTGNSADLQTVPVDFGSVSSVTDALFPALSSNNNNSVTVNIAPGGTVPSYVFGGISNGQNATAGGNKVQFMQGSVANDVNGGYAYAFSTTNPANVLYAETVGNEVVLGNGTAARTVFGGNSTAVHENGSTGTVNAFSDSNKVTVNGATISEEIFGGKSIGSGEGPGLVNLSAQDNEVFVGTGTTVAEEVYGGYAMGNMTSTGNMVVNTSDNRVTIASGATVNGSVFGGYAEGLTLGTGTIAVTANNNTVSISDARVNGDVYGGYVLGDTQLDTSTTARATGNTVNISGNSSFSANTSIFGGFVETGTTGTTPPGSDVLTGNTLNVSTSGINIKQVGNFETYNFYLPSSTTNNTVMIQTSDGADLTGSTVNIKAIAPGVALNSGDKVYLLKTGGLTGNPVLVNSANVQQGYSLQYDLTMAEDSNDIFATVSAASVNPKTKSFLEGRLAGLALLTQGADIVAGQGMSSAIAAAEQQEGRLTVFGTVSGGTSRYKTGSHIDLDGFGLMAGVSTKQDNLAGAVFVEGGWGSYDSHNNFSNGSVHGDGDTHYYGIGLLGRATLKSGMYLDGSFRVGKTSTDYTGKNYLDALGNQAHYKSKVTYVSAHAGVGYLTPVNQVTDLDLTAKYLWSRQGSDSVNVGSDPVHFDSENSRRLRGMAKVLRKVSPQLTVTGALGYEYEFDGKAKGTLYHMYGMDSPSLEGGSGIGEIGLEYKPQNNQRLSLEAKLAGYVGQREGVSGQVRMNYAF